MKRFIALGVLVAAETAGLFAQETNVASVPQQVTLLTSSSLVYDNASRNLGYLEGVVADQDSGKIQFGLVSLANPAYRAVVTPIPWPCLQRTADAQSYGGTAGKFQKFAVPFGRETLLKAPRVNMAARAGMDDPTWMANSYRFFGAISGMGVPPSSSSERDAVMEEEEEIEPSDAPWPYYGGLTGAVEDIMYMGTNLYGPGFRAVVLEIVSPRSVKRRTVAAPPVAVSEFVQASNFFATNISRITNSLKTRNVSPGQLQR